ncbi:MAG: hypothetical protein WC708_00605 [Lentisphaeria bacterium]
MSAFFGSFDQYRIPGYDPLIVTMEKVYSEVIPWIPDLWLELWKDFGGNNYHLRLKKTETKEICEFVNGIPIFKENTNIPIVGVQAQQMTDAEKLCLSVMPKNYGMSGEIAKIMKDPWWQKILDYISVHYTMSV